MNASAVSAKARAHGATVRAPAPKAAPAKKRDPARSLVRQTVQKLRERILSQSEPGSFLGSEEELIAWLGISRPTFRQAARLLEHEQLLAIKRGIGGGFFARPPSAQAVSRLAAIFLNTQGATLSDINEACKPLVVEAARRLARNPSIAVRRQLLEFVDAHEGFEKADDQRSYLRVIFEFEQLLARLAGNPAIELMVNAMRDLVRDPRHGYFHIDRGRAAVHAEFHRRLAQAIRAGDAEMAVLVMQRHFSSIDKWLKDSRVEIA